MQRLRILVVATAIGLGTVPALACDGADRSAARAQAFAAADADGNGALTAEEFATFEEVMRQEMAKAAFARLDADGDGQVTASELEAGRPGRRGRRR
jgi:Ca2+-binding EF-hand superfamily protein